MSWLKGEELRHPAGTQSRTAALYHREPKDVVRASDQDASLWTSIWKEIKG